MSQTSATGPKCMELQALSNVHPKASVRVHLIYVAELTHNVQASFYGRLDSTLSLGL